MSADTPFDRRLRRLRRDRAAPRFENADYLHRLATDELIERLGTIKRDFRDALDLETGGGYGTDRLRSLGMNVTPADPGTLFARPGGVQCDEDRLPFADRSFDLVFSVGALDSVNDLPGALILIRRILRPDGLFLAGFAGAGSLPRLKSAMLAADALGEGTASPRIHPQIDVRAAGDLLQRAGFALPVADSTPVTVRFSSLASLVADLRAMGATNLLVARSRRPLGRAAFAAAIGNFQAAADSDGKTAERFEIISMIGWAPSPDQPRAAEVGGATRSSATTFR